MKYLGLAYFSPEKFAAMAPDQVERLVSQCPALDERMRATGKVLLAASLGDVAGWTTLRPRNGRTQVSDGPYTESKEVVGGLFIIEADDHDEALRLASMHPAATLGEEGGWAVELIPILCLGRRHLRPRSKRVASGWLSRPNRKSSGSKQSLTYGPPGNSRFQH